MMRNRNVQLTINNDIVVFQNKIVAANIVPLPQGTVVFEDVKTEWYTGKIHKLTQNPTHSRGRQSVSEDNGNVINVVYEVDHRFVYIIYLNIATRSAKNSIKPCI